MGVGGDDIGWFNGKCDRCIAAPRNLTGNDAGPARLDRSIQMPTDPAVFDADLLPRGGFDPSRPDRRSQTDPLPCLDSDDVDGRLMWQRRGNVYEILARAGLFQGVEPSAVSALTKQLQPVDFPRGHTMFAEGEPGTGSTSSFPERSRSAGVLPTAARIC